jgi:hypothetical protein
VEKKGRGQLQTPSPLTLDLDEKKFLSFFVGEERGEGDVLLVRRLDWDWEKERAEGERTERRLTPTQAEQRAEALIGGAEGESPTHAKPNKEERL